jgi:hypothetical protein
MTKQTTAPKLQTPAKKNLFKLSPADLKMISGGKGIIPGPVQ